MQTETLLKKIKTLPPEKIAEVENFVKLLQTGMNQSAREKSKPVSLRGSWASAFPNDFELEKTLQDVRQEWSEEWNEKGDFVG